MRVLTISLACLGLAAHPLASQTLDPPAGRNGLASIDLPSLDGVEASVARQIESALTSVKAVLAAGDPDDAALASVYGQLARLFHAYELFNAAEAAYGNASVLTPGVFEWIHLKGHSQRQAGRLAASADSFRQAVLLNPRYPAAGIWLADVELQLGRPEEAARILDEVSPLASGSAAVSNLKGRIAMAVDQPRDAVRHFEEALQLAPESTRIHYSVGMAYRELGRIDEARAHLLKRGKVGVRPRDPVLEELQQLPEGERAHSLQGRLAYQAGSYSEAAKAFLRAVDAAPNSAGAHVNLASALAASGDEEGAIRHFRAALEIEPSQQTAHFNLGALAFGARRYAEAAQHYAAALEADPHDLEARLELARSWRRAKRLDRAIPELERILAESPSDPRAAVELGVTLVDAERFRDALDALEEGRRRFPGHAPTALALARLLAACPERSLRDGPRAVGLAEQAFAASATVASAETLALSLAEARRCDEAIDWQRRVIESAVEAGLPNISTYKRSLAAYVESDCREGAIP